MTIEETKAINPVLMAVEEQALLINRAGLYEHFHEAWVFNLKPLLNMHVGWDCKYPELQDSTVWNMWVEHLSKICTKLK